jgi:hypothetical protein
MEEVFFVSLFLVVNFNVFLLSVCNVMKEVGIRAAYGALASCSKDENDVSDVRNKLLQLLHDYRELRVEHLFLAQQQGGSGEVNTHSIIGYRNAMHEFIGLIRIVRLLFLCVLYFLFFSASPTRIVLTCEKKQHYNLFIVVKCVFFLFLKVQLLLSMFRVIFFVSTTLIRF